MPADWPHGEAAWRARYRGVGVTCAACEAIQSTAEHDHGEARKANRSSPGRYYGVKLKDQD